MTVPHQRNRTSPQRRARATGPEGLAIRRAGIIFTDETHRISVDQPGRRPDDRLRACELEGQTVFALIEFEEGQSAGEMSDQLALRGTWNGELAVTQKNGDDFPAGTRINRVDDPQSGMPAHYIVDPGRHHRARGRGPHAPHRADRCTDRPAQPHGLVVAPRPAAARRPSLPLEGGDDVPRSRPLGR